MKQLIKILPIQEHTAIVIASVKDFATVSFPSLDGQEEQASLQCVLSKIIKLIIQDIFCAFIQGKQVRHTSSTYPTNPGSKF